MSTGKADPLRSNAHNIDDIYPHQSNQVFFVNAFSKNINDTKTKNDNMLYGFLAQQE